MGRLYTRYLYCLLFCLLAIPSVAQQSTRILDSIVSTNGQPITGFAQITPSPDCLPFNGITGFARDTIKYCIGKPGIDCTQSSSTPGLIDINLLPTATGSVTTPAKCTYVVRVAPDRGDPWNERWDVPVSGVPVRRKDIVVTAGLGPVGTSISGTSVRFSQPDGCARFLNNNLVSTGSINCNATTPPIYEQNCIVTFTGVTSLTVPGATCNFQTTAIITQCYTNAGLEFPCGYGGVDPISFDITYQWVTAQTGKVVISGRSGATPNQAYIFDANTAATILAATHGFNHNRLSVACQDLSYKRMPCYPTVDPNNFSVILSFPVRTQGYVIIMGR